MAQRGNGTKLMESVLIDRGDGTAAAPGNPLSVKLEQTDPLQIVRTPSSGSFLTMSGINLNGTGDMVVIPAVAGKTIRVFRLLAVSSVAGSITPKDGSTVFCGPMPFAANGSITLDYDGEPWLSCSVGNPFVLSLSVAGQLSGLIGYTVT